MTNPIFQQLLHRAAGLTRTGDLAAATAAIQQALGGSPFADTAAPPFRPPQPSRPSRPRRTPVDVTDVAARTVTDAATPTTEPLVARQQDAGAPGFAAGQHAEAAGERSYKLYVPPAAGSAPLPLVVMLHGCTQNPDDFAAGTGMNGVAAAGGFYVLYPAQSSAVNPQRCWNWFKHSHQRRGHGEPAIIAGMVRAVMSQHAVDARRIYVAGLSAGGAMAAIVGDAYPELFAAVGVHSGLAAGVAIDLPSALAAMKSGGTHRAGPPSGMPTIVFHGDADRTVHPANGAQVAAASAGGAAAVHTERRNAGGSRSSTVTTHRDADGTVLAEHWCVHGAPHAWSGGSVQGTYTDPSGPDATAEMVRFFLDHPRQLAH